MVAQQTKNRCTTSRKPKADPVKRARAEVAKGPLAEHASKIADIATLDIEPIPEVAARAAAIAEDFASIVETVRFAGVITGKTKAELIALFATEEEATVALGESLESTRDWLDGVRGLLDSAFNRLLVAGAAHLKAEGRAA